MVRQKDSKKRPGMTSLQISKETKKKLDEIGKKSETYEDIILKLLQRNA